MYCYLGDGKITDDFRVLLGRGNKKDHRREQDKELLRGKYRQSPTYNFCIL